MMINDIFDKEWIRAELRARRRRKSKLMFLRVMTTIGIILLLIYWIVIFLSLSGCSSPRLRSMGNGIFFDVAFELGGSDRGPLIREYRLPEEYEVRALIHEREGYDFPSKTWAEDKASLSKEYAREASGMRRH